jgi:hypothetical protein
MKTDSTRLFDELLKENVNHEQSEEKKLETDLNETIKKSIASMQDAFDKKLQESEERINNIILKMEGENNNGNSKKEEGSKDNAGSDEGEHISSEHEDQPEG